MSKLSNVLSFSEAALTVLSVILGKFEIFKDFNVGLTFYDLYDNRPPEGAVSKNDFGVNTTLGYVFGK